MLCNPDILYQAVTDTSWQAQQVSRSTTMGTVDARVEWRPSFIRNAGRIEHDFTHERPNIMVHAHVPLLVYEGSITLSSSQARERR